PGAAQAAGAGRVARLGPGPPAARCRRPRRGRRAADPRRRRQAPRGPGDADVIRAGRARGHVVSSAPGLADPRPATPLEEVAVAFGRALRRAGVAAGPERVRMLAEALQHVDVMSRREVYWAGRVTCCSSQQELDVYDRVFADFFATMPPAVHSRERNEVVRPAP